jgi:Helix-loop-helix DNA-binding domain
MKIMLAEDEDTFDGGGVDDSKKSERKRKRERQRRSDLANAFDELSALVAQIDPDDSDTGTRKKRRKSGVGEPEVAAADPDNSSMTRLDLIGRTTTVLRRLQRENADLRRRLEEQQSRAGGDEKVSRGIE